MNLKFGYVSTSFVDSPSGTATTVFFNSCDLSCDYCHQKELLGGKLDGELYDLDQIIEKIENNKFKSGAPRTEWLVLSGGEPTLFLDELEAIASAGKNSGRKIGLWTNGLVVGSWKLICGPAPVVDWVNLDLKYIKSDYAHFTGAEPTALYDNLGHLSIEGRSKFRLNTVVLRTRHSVPYLKAMAYDVLTYPFLMEDEPIEWRFVPFRMPPTGTLGGLSQGEEMTKREVAERVVDSIHGIKNFDPVIYGDG